MMKELKTLELSGKVNTLMEELLKMPQADCPVKHTFMPGVYMREITFPAGTAAVGQFHKYDHINILVKGRVTVVNDDGSTTDLTAPMTFIGHPGQKCGYVHEETIWINVHYCDCTDVETMEASLYDLSKAPQRGKGISSDRKAIDTDDYNLLVEDMVLNPEEIKAEVADLENQMAMPYGIYKAKVSDSLLHGKGVFATGNIKKGELVGPVKFQGKRTPLGRYCNHSKNPNAEFKLFGEDIYLVALTDISGCQGGNDGEEITTNYRRNLMITGRKSCQQP
jgi:hypothetical protein